MNTFSLGIPVYNEGLFLPALISSIEKQSGLRPCEIIFILSGCTDNSESLIMQYSKKNPAVRILKQPERMGKSEAVNAFIREAKSDILVLCCADIVLEENCLSILLSRFEDHCVGMAGAKSVPLRNANNLMFMLNCALWQMHDLLSLRRPKLGELVAFRNVVERIPADSAADEVYLEALITKSGYSICYAQKAIVHNSYPLNLRDFYTQRVRIFWGHIDVKRKLGYSASSMDVFLLLRVLLVLVFCYPKYILPSAVLVFIELCARLSALAGYYCRKDFKPYVWPQYSKFSPGEPLG